MVHNNQGPKCSWLQHLVAIHVTCHLNKIALPYRQFTEKTFAGEDSGINYKNRESFVPQSSHCLMSHYIYFNLYTLSGFTS